MLNTKFSISEKGVSLYFSIVIMAILLALALGISTISLGQIKIMKEISDSVVAFYAADTGIEEAMYKYWVQGIPLSAPYASSTIGSASYSVNAYNAGDPECPASNYNYYCIKSFGTYQATKRAIEVNQ